MVRVDSIANHSPAAERGQLTALVRETDWSRTPLGSMVQWPQSLRTLVDLLLAHPLPMILLWGPDLVQIYNDSYRVIAGGKHPRALGLPTRECWPELWHINAPIYERVLAGGESVLLEEQLFPITRHGIPEDACFTVTYGPARDDTGAVAGVFVTVTETTGRVRADAAQQELLSRVERQAHVFDTALTYINDFAYIFDCDGRFLYVNKPLLDLWGLTLDQAVGKNFFDLKYPDDLAAKLQRQIQQVIETKAVLVDETPYTSPGGTPGFYEYIFSPVLAADGKVEVVAGSTRVITARKQLEVERERLVAALEHQRSRLTAVIEQAPAFICTLRGPDHVFELVNERYYELVGRRHIVGNAVRDALPEVAGQGFFELLDNVYRTGRTFAGNEMPVLLHRADGCPLDKRFVNFVYQPLRGDDAGVSGIFVHGVDVTETVLARQAVQASEALLRTSEERLAFSVGAAELGTFYCPMPLGRIEWNDKCKEQFWLPPEAEVDFDRFYSILHPDDREPTRLAVERAVFDRKAYDVEYRTVAPDGRERWVRALGRGFHDAAGNPTRFDGVTMDITQRKLAESRNRLLVAIDDAVRSLTEPEEVTATCARLLAEHLGADRCAYADVEADEDTFNLTGDYNRGVPSIVGRYRFADFGAEVLRLMREDRPYVVEDVDTHRPAVGDLSYYRQTMIRAVICVPLHKAGRFVAAMAVHQRVPRRWLADDVDLVGAIAARCWESIERGRVLRVVRQSEVHFRELADAMPQIVWAARPDGVLDYYNRRWFEYINAPAGAADGATWDRYVHPDDLPRTYEAWQAALRSGEPYAVEFRIRDAAGAYRWFLVRANAIEDGDGHVVRWFGTCTDVHDQRLLQQQNESLLESERTARAEAEAASRAKDHFLAVLSHELRTPLSPVVMMVPAMELDPEMPFKFREDLAMVRRNIDLEVKLIDDLLDLSRVTSGKLRLQMQFVRVHELLRHVVQSSVAETADKCLRVRYDFRADNDQLTGDSARLHQVFWNLLRNAIKFTSEGGDIIVSTWNGDDGRLHVEVKDTGVGIRPDILPRIFDAFEQGELRMTRQFGGLGLGLAIAKAVVEMHGGSIRAASDGPGRGATFTVELETVDRTAMTEPDAVVAPAAARQHPRSRVLLVEDHPDTSRAMARLLSSSGYDVRSANSVASALQLAAAEPFDIVVSDIGLPDATGYELMEQIKGRHGISGIALSGYGMEEDMRKSRDAGFLDHVVKPVNVAQLEAAIERVLNNHARSRADASTY